MTEFNNSIDYLKEQVFDICTSFKLGTYDFDPESNYAMSHWLDYGFIRKDFNNDELVKILNCTIRGNQISVLTETGVELSKNIDKENRFFERVLNVKVEDLQDWLETDAYADWIETEPTIQIKKVNTEFTFSLFSGYHDKLRLEFFEQKDKNEKSYTAKILAKNKGGFLVEINGVEAFLPGSLAAPNKLVNFESMIGKNVDVMIEDYVEKIDEIIVSHKKYLKYEIPKRLAELEIGTFKSGFVTGCAKFGIFVEFDGIFTGLIHTSEMTDEVYEMFTTRQYTPGSEVEFYIKEINSKNAIILTTKKENVILFTYKNLKEKYEGQILEGTVVNIKPELGVFVNLLIEERSDINGLIFRTFANRLSLKIGDEITVKLVSVDLVKENTKLIPVEMA